MQYYDVVYLFKTSEIRPDLGVWNSAIIYHEQQIHILFKKNWLSALYIYIDESLSRVPRKVCN